MAVLRESSPIAHKSALVGVGGEVPHISKCHHPHRVKYLFFYIEMRESKNNQHEPRNDLFISHTSTGDLLSFRY